MAEENRSTPEGLVMAKELTLIEARVKRFSMESHQADNNGQTSASGNSKFSGANDEENSIRSAKSLYDGQDSESMPMKEGENIYIGTAADKEYEASPFWQYPFLVHGVQPNRSAVRPTTQTHDMDLGNNNKIPGVNNIPVGVHVHDHTSSTPPPTAIQYSATTYSIPQHFNPGEVAGTPEFPMPRHSMPGQFIIPGQTAGAAAAPQDPTPASSSILPELLPIPVPDKASDGTAAAGATGTSKRKRVRERLACAFCQELGHLVDNCPFLPCKHCNNMGHIGKNCLTLPRRGKCVAKCSLCEKPSHRRHECPSRPCRYCGVMGHVGRACPIMTEKRLERKRKADAWRQAPR